MLGIVLLLAWLCEVWGRPVDTRKTSFQFDEGYNNLNRGSVGHSETTLDFEGDYAVQEGDILLQSDRNAVNQLWPDEDGYVSLPYEIDTVLDERTEYIVAAFGMISEKTCVKFHPRTNETDYLHFMFDKGCASLVGFTGGEQPILIGSKCNAGNICHEVLHALGLYHEHSRPDRDKYITIIYDNIASGKKDNFMIKNGNTLGVMYDPDSIMHYGDNYFSRNGNRTIIPKQSGVKIGQRTHMSQLDVERIRKLYHCDKETP